MILSADYIGKYRAMAYDSDLHIIIMYAGNIFYYADTFSWGVRKIL